MDRDQAPHQIETLRLGRAGESAWWQGGPHRHSGLFVVMLALVTFAFGGYTLLSSERNDHAEAEPTTHSAPRPHPPRNILMLRQQRAVGVDEIRYAGLTMMVPDHWGSDRVTRCGGVLADTVIYPGGSRLPCSLSSGCCPASKLQHSSVQFIDPVAHTRTATSRGIGLGTTIERAPIQRGGGGYVQFIDVGRGELQVVLRSPYRPVIEQLSASLRLTARGLDRG